MRLLLIEDNLRLAESVVIGLEKAGFAVDVHQTAGDGKAALSAFPYDAVILDLGLPDEDGMNVLAELRDRRDQTPVLILTARDAVEDRVRGLNEGADDYLLKPFAMEELVARVRAMLRRPGRALGVILDQGNLQFDSIGREARVNGQILVLPRRELDALETLMRRYGRVVTKAAMEEALYRSDDEIGSNVIEVLIHRLRKRLAQAGSSVHIHTMRGIGYILSDKAP